MGGEADHLAPAEAVAGARVERAGCGVGRVLRQRREAVHEDDDLVVLLGDLGQLVGVCGTQGALTARGQEGPRLAMAGDDDPLGPEAAGEEAEEGAGRVVGPVDVLDPEQRRAPGATGDFSGLLSDISTACKVMPFLLAISW